MVLEPDGPADPSITYAVVWKQRPNLLSSLPNLQGDLLHRRRRRPYLRRPRPAGRADRRVVADNLTQHMTEYVVWRVLDHHRQGALYRCAAGAARSGTSRRSGRPATSRSASWASASSAARRRRRCLSLGFRVNGWSRTEQPIDGRFDISWRQRADAVPQRDRHSGGAAAADAGHAAASSTTGCCSELRRRNGLGGAVLINAGRGKLQRMPTSCARWRTAR